MTRPSRISIGAPCFNESEVLPHLRRELTALADRLRDRYSIEIVLVDDGSRDDTWKQIVAWANEDSRVCAVSLSRNFGHQAALSCAYNSATGDAAVSIDADLQDPPEVIEAMLREWENGADVVFAIREQRDGETIFKRVTAAAFYRLLRAMGAHHVKPDSGDFRLMSRRALEALNGMQEYHRFIRGMVGWIGFKSAEVRYHRHARRAGTTKYPLRKMLAFAFDAIISFSFSPLRLAFAAAMGISSTIFAYLVFVVVRHLFMGGDLVPGWTSLLLTSVGFGAANLVCLGIMGEYIGRTYEQGKRRPLYLVQSVVADQQARARAGRSENLSA